MGTLELLGQKSIVSREGELDLGDDAIGSQATWASADDTDLEDAVDAARDARIVIMNPPFTNRANMGEKFPTIIQQRLRSRVDALENILVSADKGLDGIMDKNALRPLFVGLADRCIDPKMGALTMILPTVALCAPAGLEERRILAGRYHIHTIVTSHDPGQINISQNTAINESIVIAKRNQGHTSPTRIIQLDRMPTDEKEVQDLYLGIVRCQKGHIDNGWGHISYWPADRVETGDWTSSVWRSPELAEAAAAFATHPELQPIAGMSGLKMPFTGRDLFRGAFERTRDAIPGGFWVLGSKAADGQMTIQSTPDEYWSPKTKKRSEELLRLNGGTYSEVAKMLRKAGRLLITAGQDNSTARLTATADDKSYVGSGWIPITGLAAEEAKAVALFVNSTPGRLQLMRNPGRKMSFPTYRPAGIGNIKIPDIKDVRIRGILADCWERTKDMIVPQFRDGECEVRRLWDEAVAEAMGWDAEELTRLRLLLHQEPHVRGLGYGQYADELDIEPANRERFNELADQWEIETVFHSNSAMIVKHPAYREIISMGEPVVPLILQRMQAQGGHWFYALRDITGANPVKSDDRGKVAVMQASWLEWGEANGHI